MFLFFFSQHVQSEVILIVLLLRPFLKVTVYSYVEFALLLVKLQTKNKTGKETKMLGNSKLSRYEVLQINYYKYAGYNNHE